MRKFFAVAVLPVVSGCETFFYKDEECAEEVNEVEYLPTNVGILSAIPGASGSGTAKIKTKLFNPLVSIPGRCYTYAEVQKVKPGDGDEIKIKSTFGIKGVGLSGSSQLLFGEKVPDDCFEYDGKKAAEDTGSPPKYFKFQVTTGSTNVCNPSAGFPKKKKDKDNGYFWRTLCGPVPGAVVGIVLSTIGLLLSFAGLGLAAAAGK